MLWDPSIMHYLDDYWGCKREANEVNDQLNMIICICQIIGMLISPKKMVWATTQICLLGMDIDSVEQQILIPEQKRTVILNKINFVLQSKTIKNKTLHSLAGSLNFYRKAKPGSRAFIRQIYDAQSITLLLFYHVNVTGELKRNLHMWKSLLDKCMMGAPFLHLLPVTDFQCEFYTDASRAEKLGWGTVFRKEWMYSPWLEKFIETEMPSIAWLEHYALTVALVKWQSAFQ